jgi:hypothetical protein
MLSKSFITKQLERGEKDSSPDKINLTENNEGYMLHEILYMKL